MKLTTEELIELVEIYNSKAFEFEAKFKDNTDLNSSELYDYNASNIIVLLSLIKLNQIMVDEMSEKCLNSLHK